MLKLRELRKKCGMTMKELGKEMGVAESTISQYETGKRQPDYETLLRLGEFFGVSVDYILGNDSPIQFPVLQANEHELKAAFFEGAEDLPPEEMEMLWQDAKEYINYKIAQRRRNK